MTPGPYPDCLMLYLDTSVISLLFQDETGERQAVNFDFFRRETKIAKVNFLEDYA
ncbi:hypothetical protein HYR69_07110 [Candidatus Sumerlaeota bacterium]|nr:hypothetical protein [Candidatus Sumerlaeota bacterium]